MTKFKPLLVGLIASAILTAPLAAQESRSSARHPANRVFANTEPGAQDVDGRFCYPAPRVGAFATQPWDNETPCEPMSMR
jgi:hypothetical protein